MNRKLSVFILLAASISAFGQQTPESKRQAEGRFILSAPFGSSYLGVETQEITKENFSKYNLREVRGVAIAKVAEDSPAARAGLQKGDVILKFDGEEVTSVRKLTRLIGEVAPDHQAKITIARNGGESELTITVGKREMTAFQNGDFNWENMIPMPGLPASPRVPMSPGRVFPPAGDGNFQVLPNGENFIFRSDKNRRIGVTTAPLTKQLGDYFGIADGRGVLIDSVRENSPAARAGLKAGDVVTEIDGKAIKNSADLVRAINDKKDGETVSLTFLRDKNRQIVTIAPEVSKETAIPFGEFQNFGDGQPMRFRMRTPNAPAAPAPPNQIKPAP